MKTYEHIGSLFWLLIAVYVCVESVRLGLGTPRNPGMGFMTFGGSVLLGVFSLVVFFRGYLEKTEPGPEGPPARRLWTRVLIVALALMAYSILMPVLGYLINTFLLMTLLFGIIRSMKWWWVFVSSFATTLATYYIFSKWLNLQFPHGLLGL